MKITHQHIFGEIVSYWPNMRTWYANSPGHIRFLDLNYEALDISGYAGMIAASKVNLIDFIREVGDCDDSAEILLAEIRKARWLEAVKTGINSVPFAIGRCDGKFSHRNGRHRMLIAYTTTGLRLIEPQTDEIRKINKKDKAEFIEI